MSTAQHAPLGWRSVVASAAIIATTLCCQSGCVATKYKLAKKDTPPVQPLNIPFPPALPLVPTLASLISYGGPGSWKREALWDEYVVTLENRGDQSLSIDSAALADSAGTQYAAGTNPWALEKQSKTLEKQYKDHGQAFLRTAGPGVLVVGAGAAAASATAGAAMFVSPALAGAAVATVVVLPVYYLTVVGINHYNKKAVMTEFKRRRLLLPLIIAPGETRTGSLFIPMVRSPGSLTLKWSNEGGSSVAELPLEFLHALHVPAAPPIQPSKNLLGSPTGAVRGRFLPAQNRPFATGSNGSTPEIQPQDLAIEYHQVYRTSITTVRDCNSAVQSAAVSD